MRKQLSYLFALMISVFVFTGCEDKNGLIDPPIPIDKQIMGTYASKLDISLGGESVAQGVAQTIYITEAGVNEIKLELKDFELDGVKLGDIALTNCPIAKTIEGYAFTGEQKITLTGIGECDVVAKGAIVGSKLTGDIDVSAGGGTIKVKVTFTGTKLEIKSFTFDSPLVHGTPVIDNAKGTITFTAGIAGNVDDELLMAPTITFSDKATIKPASGVARDFSTPRTYTLTAEDGVTKKVYTIVVVAPSKFSFDNWVPEKEGEENVPDTYGWANCNAAVMLIKAFGAYAEPAIEYTGAYPVTKTTDAYSGTYAARLESVDTKGAIMMGTVVPRVTAGSMFLGSFNAMNAMADPMTTTYFGSMYDKEPVAVTGYYKYTPGADFYTSEGLHGTLDKTKKDSCSISAVLYEVTTKDETLDGNTIYQSDKIYASAMFTNDQVVSAYTKFDLKLNYVKPYDPTKKYKLAVIFSASKDGANYNAAIGSVLYIDEVEIINK